jgi:hypothetical protein
MPADEELTVVRLQSADVADFGHLFAIYCEAIPASERKSEVALRSMVENPLYVFLTAKVEHSVVGFSIVKEFTGTTACLLEYMAVAHNERGRGIGGALFRNASAHSTGYMLLEVDSERGETADRGIQTRRKDFYRKLGCRQLQGLRFAMPSVIGEAPPPMDLLLFKRDMPAAIGKSQLAKWLECIYTEIYGQRSDDTRIGAMLAELPDTIQLV